ncbi:MAG: extradiol ring-cleavage dioxygenase [Actinomycetota bacterium]|nr:extradiol ring-cleavage dioxygenase [Actinomycetota bacterium]MDG1197337.1 extradiol ring-cleavage dioxygenase [Actinomycetota bacterium]MDG2121819.1 extradiol ring-cleavage dioxygenase [Actinomycetota bacterium]
MTLVFAGVCSHAPGIVGRAHLADEVAKKHLYEAFDSMRERLEESRPDVLIVVAAEHFANFFMNNMPSFAIGMAESYEGPIEDPEWLGIPHTRIPGARSVSESLINEVMQGADISYAEEWKFDHGIMVPLHFLTPNFNLPVIPVNINCQGPPLAPLHRVWAFGEALGAAIEKIPERVALIGTGGISHWPATPDSGKINEKWDRNFLDQWSRCDKEAMLTYTDKDSYLDAGQGAFEIRTFMTISAATTGLPGTIHFYEPIPIFAVGCTIATIDLPIVNT